MEFSNRPGSALGSLIPEWIIADTSGCGCASYSREMDVWGHKGCTERKEEIVTHLVRQSPHLIKPLALLPECVKRYGAAKLLDQALALSVPEESDVH